MSKSDPIFVIVVMNTPNELTTFKGSEYARKVFYLYENVVTKSLPDSERELKR